MIYPGSIMSFGWEEYGLTSKKGGAIATPPWMSNDWNAIISS